jgi:hypothetical protein
MTQVPKAVIEIRPSCVKSESSPSPAAAERSAISSRVHAAFPIIPVHHAVGSRRAAYSHCLGGQQDPRLSTRWQSLQLTCSTG